MQQVKNQIEMWRKYKMRIQHNS